MMAKRHIWTILFLLSCLVTDAQEYFKKYENKEYSSKIFDEILIYNLEKIGKAN